MGRVSKTLWFSAKTAALVPLAYLGYLGVRATHFAFKYHKTTVAGLLVAGYMTYSACTGTPPPTITEGVSGLETRIEQAKPLVEEATPFLLGAGVAASLGLGLAGAYGLGKRKKEDHQCIQRRPQTRSRPIIR